MRLDPSSNLGTVRSLYHAGRLCLFVGAGVSVSCGLPDWATLSQRVIAQAWPDKVSSYDYEAIATRNFLSEGNPLEAMRMAKRILGNRFNSVVAECLYSDKTHLSATVEAIVSLTQVRRICCFNYDDVLEEAFMKHSFEFEPVLEGDRVPLDSNLLLIFHPHGFLPQTNEFFQRDYKASPIVLSEDDYHELYATPYSWANLIQIYLLMNYSVLFVGCSLNDPSIRRLLDIAKKMRVTHQHFALLKNPTYHPEVRGWNGLAYTNLDRLREADLGDRGITALWFKEYSESPEILHSISQ